jgi:hypothetical protein
MLAEQRRRRRRVRSQTTLPRPPSRPRARTPPAHTLPIHLIVLALLAILGPERVIRRRNLLQQASEQSEELGSREGSEVELRAGVL